MAYTLTTLVQQPIASGCNGITVLKGVHAAVDFIVSLSKVMLTLLVYCYHLGGNKKMCVLL